MKILAISCSDQLLSVSLNIDGEIYSEEICSNRDHNQFVLDFVDRLLSVAQIALGQVDAVAYGQGPGSYTGLRVAAGIAQGIAFGADMPVVAVSTMAALAQQLKHEKVFVAMDAKKDKLFVGFYVKSVDGIVDSISEEVLTTIDEVRLSGKNWIGAGDGWDLRAKELEKRFERQIDGWVANQQPHAKEISILGAEYSKRNQGMEAHLAIPRYLSPYFSS